MSSEFWKDYQEKALSTSVYPNKGKNKIYPTLGLMNELGEVAGKLKKIIRDDNCILTEKRRQMIIEETGDVLWYMAAVCYELKFEIIEIIISSKAIKDEKKQSIYQEILETQVSMGIVAMNINDCETEKCGNSCDHLKPIHESLKYIFFHIDNICQDLSICIQKVAEKNIENLFQRGKRGTIHGDGDNR